MLSLDWVHPIDHVPVDFLGTWWRRQRTGIDETVGSSHHVHQLTVAKFLDLHFGDGGIRDVDGQLIHE